MQLSNQGKAFITKCEDCKLNRYRDSADLWTIGVGHLITGQEQPPIGETITTDRSNELLTEDTQHAVNAINQTVKATLAQYEFDALTSLVFNIGTEAFKTSTLLKELNQGNKIQAAEQFKVWIYAGGKVMPGLKNRRQKEYDLFMNAIYI